MLTEQELSQEISRRFGPRIVRHASEKIVFVSQVKRMGQPHISDEEITRLMEHYAQLPGLYDPEALRPAYKYAKENGRGSYRDVAVMPMSPAGWMMYAGESIIAPYVDANKLGNFEPYLTSGVNLVARTITNVAEFPETSLAFDTEHGLTSDGRRIVSACPAVKEARRMFVAFYDVMKDDVYDKTGRLAAAVAEMQSKIKL